ncbi:MAG: endonuclease/exonuclease/phosphatase family protein [Phycisphaerae bacterium]|nr:endonuclease/exonuclease/phosphatase family protein [Phycisphaerae bacterium]
MNSERNSIQNDSGKANPSAREEPNRVPQTSLLARAGTAGAVLVLAALYIVVLFALLWQPDFRTTSRLHTGFSLIAFYIDTFAFHVGLATAVLLVVSAARKRWRLCLAALPPLAVTLGPSLSCYLPADSGVVSGKVITVMSVNPFGANRQRMSLIREITEADPDILFVQEYTERWHEALHPALKGLYPHVVTIARRDYFGLAVYSKVPFESPGAVCFYPAELNLPCLKVVMRIDGRPVTFFNIHLIPPVGIGCFHRQGVQLMELLDMAVLDTNPVVMVGDFNFTGNSRFAAEVDRVGLRSCHELAGWGRGATWPVNGLRRHVPGLRIDHIYMSRELTCPWTRTGEGEGSDHRPIIAIIGFAG